VAGACSLSGGWEGADGTSQETTSDSHATGLITFVLQQSACYFPATASNVDEPNDRLAGGIVETRH
jgi:hypothetical protein